jgi:hypothetical protein
MVGCKAGRACLYFDSAALNLDQVGLEVAPRCGGYCAGDQAFPRPAVVGGRWVALAATGQPNAASEQ